MGVVNTTYTFTSTDTITSAKMNNIIDETTFTSDAIQGSTLQVVSPGKLAVSAGGITSNELASSAVTQAKFGTNVAGTGPLVVAYSSVATSVPTGATPTKITLGTEVHDTNNNFANSRFTPTVAGYYQINGFVNTTADGLAAYISINGSKISGNVIGATTYRATVSTVFFLNGSTDYIELFASHSQGTNVSVTGDLRAFLIRSA
jgi:hypothetical protein